MLHWIPKPIIDSIHIQSLLYLLLWFGVFNYKTCRNTSKDLGHNSRTSFSQEDHLILLGEFFAVCQENHTRLKLEKCDFMQETMQYVGFDVGYGWWTPAASKAKPLMDAKVRHEDPK